MNDFKDFYDNATILNALEMVHIESVGHLECKVDTGNDGFNVLHGVNLEFDEDQGTVSFDTAMGKRITGIPVEKIITINVGANTMEERPLISLNFEVAGQKFEDCKFTVGDRSTNKQKCLLGRKFLGDKQVYVKA